MEMSVPAVILTGMSNEMPPQLRELVRLQAGVVTRQQAIDSGLSVGAINSKVRFARWRSIYRGVYATFTGPIAREAQLWAAVLYAGKGAQLSHETAAELNRLSDRQSSPIHVSIPVARRVRPVKGIVIHRSGHIDAGRGFRAACFRTR